MEHQSPYEYSGVVLTADVRVDQNGYEVLEDAFAESAGEHMSDGHSGRAKESFELFLQIDAASDAAGYVEDETFIEFRLDGPLYGAFTMALANDIRLYMERFDMEKARRAFSIWSTVSDQIEHQIDERFSDATVLDFLAGVLEEDVETLPEPEPIESMPSLFEGVTAGDVTDGEENIVNSYCACCEGSECLVTDRLPNDVVEKTASSGAGPSVTWYECLTCGRDYEHRENAMDHHCP